MGQGGDSKIKHIPIFSEQFRAEGSADSAREDSAEKESEAIDTENLSRDAAEKEHRRTQKFKDHFEKIMIMAIWLIAGCSALVFIVFIWHLIGFPYCRWLSDDRLDTIQTFIFGGFGGAAVTSVSHHFRKRID